MPLLDFVVLPNSFSILSVISNSSRGDNAVVYSTTQLQKRFWLSNPHGSVSMNDESELYLPKASDSSSIARFRFSFLL